MWNRAETEQNSCGNVEQIGQSEIYPRRVEGTAPFQGAPPNRQVHDFRNTPILSTSVITRLASVDIASKPHILCKIVAGELRTNDQILLSYILVNRDGNPVSSGLIQNGETSLLLELLNNDIENNDAHGVMACIGQNRYSSLIDVNVLLIIDKFVSFTKKASVIFFGAYICGNGESFYHDYY